MIRRSALWAGVLVLVWAGGGCARDPDYSSSAPGSGSGGAAGDQSGHAGSAGVPAMGPVTGSPLATFDANAEGFALNTFPESTNLANAPTPATLTWISTDGSPDPGCLKITAPYSGPNQWVDAEAPVFRAPLPNWSGRTLHVRIKLDPGSTFSGSPRLFVKTGTTYVFYTTVFAPLPAISGWQEIVLPLVSPAPVPPANAGADPSEVITFGIDPLTAPSGVPPATPATFYVDSFSID